MTKDEILASETLLRRDGYRIQADLLHELAVELRVMTRAYEELYSKHYQNKPVPIYQGMPIQGEEEKIIYGHVPGKE